MVTSFCAQSLVLCFYGYICCICQRDWSPLFKCYFLFCFPWVKDGTLIPCTAKYRSIKRSVLFKERCLSTRSRNQPKYQKKSQQQSLLVWVWLIVKEGTSVPSEFLAWRRRTQYLPCKQSMLIYESGYTADCIAETQLKVGCECKVFMLATLSPIWIDLERQIYWFTKLEELN